MSKKTDQLAAATSKSLVKEKAAADARFAKADSILLAPSPVPAPAATPVAATTAVVEPVKTVRVRTRPARPETVNTEVVRDTFSMPEGEYKLIDQIRSTLGRQGYLHTTKSAVIRAGLITLAGMSVQDLLKTMDKVQHIKPGRKAG